jgi:general secretion pathway protein N
MTYFRLPADIALLLLLCWSVALGADAPAPAQDSSSAALPNPVAAQSLERLSATVDRPLFSPSRRPPAPPPPPVARAPEPPALPPPPPDLVLSGIVMDGEGARAVVRVGAEKKNKRAQIGDDIGGWMVSQIEGRRLVLSRDGRFATFTLFSRQVDERASSESIAGQIPDRSANASEQSQPQQRLSAGSENAGAQRKRRRK